LYLLLQIGGFYIQAEGSVDDITIWPEWKLISRTFIYINRYIRLCIALYSRLAYWKEVSAYTVSPVLQGCMLQYTDYLLERCIS
jgi:hypothetical protein